MLFSATSFALVLAATTAAAQTVQNVDVGRDGQKLYTPNNLTAAVGDTVAFHFIGGNHTVTQSSFANPCTSNGGFKSGFHPANASSVSEFSITVNSTDPVWVYCGQTGHCAAGMVMAINPPATGNTFAAFLQAATNGTSSTTNSTANATSSASVTSSASASAVSGNANAQASGASASDSASAGTTTGAASSASTSAASPSGSSGAMQIVPSLAGVVGLVGVSLGLLI